MLGKLKVALSDVKNQQDANRSLAKTIEDMQIEREAMDKAHDELARRSQSLENNLQQVERACKELVAHKERLEGENYAILQQLEESNKREERYLQLIQDLEQEIRHTIKNHSETNLASMRSSGTRTPAFSDRDAMNGISDHARPLPDSALPSPTVYRLTCVADVMMSPSDRSRLSVGDSCCEEQPSVSEPSPSEIRQKPDLCESTTTIPEASSAVQQASTQSVVKPSGLKQPRNARKRNKSFHGSKDLMKDEAQSKSVIATEVDKNPLLQSAITDTVDETISTEHGPLTAAKAIDDGMNAVEIMESQEDSLRHGGVNLEVVDLEARPILQGDAEMRKKGQREDNQTTEEYSGDQSSTALPHLKISTVGLSKENPISLLSSSPPPSTPQWTAWDTESETLIRNWPRQTDLSDLLETALQLPGTALFKLPRRPRFVFTDIDKGLVVKILTNLQKEIQLSDDSVNYFLSRMETKAGVQLLDSFWYPSSLSNLSEAAGRLDLLSGTLTLIPCFRGKHWSCIEVDQKAGTITHYDSLRGIHCRGAGTLVRTAGCSHCECVRNTFSYALKNPARDSWQFLTPHCPQQANGDDCGIFMLAFLGRRAQKLDLDLDQDLDPGQCRFDMAIRFIQDILAGKSARDIMQAMSSDTKRVPFEWVEESAYLGDEDATPQDIDEEERWEKFETTYQSAGWISQLRRIAGEPQFDMLGLQMSSRFLQLVANIASPLTLVQVKQQLAELRRHQPKPAFSFNHLQGAYVAGVWHNSSTLRSSMCLRLTSWVFRNEVLQRMNIERRRPPKRQKAGKTGAQGNRKGEYQTIKNKAIDSLVREIGLQGGEAGKITPPLAGP